jgi:hypothetical protein
MFSVIQSTWKAIIMYLPIAAVNSYFKNSTQWKIKSNTATLFKMTAIIGEVARRMGLPDETLESACSAVSKLKIDRGGTWEKLRKAIVELQKDQSKQQPASKKRKLTRLMTTSYSALGQVGS